MEQLSARVEDPDDSNVNILGWTWFAGDNNGFFNVSFESVYTVTPKDAGKSIKAQVTYTDLFGTHALNSSATHLVPGDRVGSVFLSSNSPRVTHQLSARLEDPDDSNAHILGWTWFAGDNNGFFNVSFASVYTVTPKDAGKSIKAQVTYTDLFGTHSLNSSATHLVPGDRLGSVFLSSNSPRVGNQLSATVEDSDGPSVTGYVWFSGDRNVSSESNYTVTPKDAGKSIKVQVTHTDLFGTHVLNSSATHLVPGDRVGSVFLSSNSPRVGNQLSATVEDSDGPSVTGYVWFSGDRNVSSESNYTVTPKDAGKSIKVQVTYTDLFGTHSLNSSATHLVPGDRLGIVSFSDDHPEIGDLVNVEIHDDDGVRDRYCLWLIGNNTVADGRCEYTIGEEVFNNSLKVVVTYTDNFGFQSLVNKTQKEVYFPLSPLQGLQNPAYAMYGVGELASSSIHGVFDRSDLERFVVLESCDDPGNCFYENDFHALTILNTFLDSGIQLFTEVGYNVSFVNGNLSTFEYYSFERLNEIQEEVNKPLIAISISFLEDDFQHSSLSGDGALSDMLTLRSAG